MGKERYKLAQSLLLKRNNPMVLLLAMTPLVVIQLLAVRLTGQAKLIYNSITDLLIAICFIGSFIVIRKMYKDKREYLPLIATLLLYAVLHFSNLPRFTSGIVAASVAVLIGIYRAITFKRTLASQPPQPVEEK